MEGNELTIHLEEFREVSTTATQTNPPGDIYLEICPDEEGPTQLKKGDE